MGWTQCVRCSKCKRVYQEDVGNVFSIVGWYKEAAFKKLVCIYCKDPARTAAMSAESEGGLSALFHKRLNKYVPRSYMNGAWYCTREGQLRQYRQGVSLPP